jgi:hypothetical protein
VIRFIWGGAGGSPDPLSCCMAAQGLFMKWRVLEKRKYSLRRKKVTWAGRYRRDFGCLILDFEWKSQPAAAEAILQHQKFKIQNSKF